MMALVVFAIALVAVYAAKAAAVVLKHDDLAANCTSFSWMRPELPEEGQPAPWVAAEQREADSRVAVAGIRRAGRVGA
jgi:hypothetical protein